MHSAVPAEVLDFGPFRLHSRNRKLFCGGEEVHIGGRSMDVLLALARRQGELVSKEQLFAAAWPDIFVHESNLKVAIATLRRTLREYSPSLEFITTVVGRGYRLAFESRPEDPSGETEFPITAGTSLPEIGTVIGRDAEIADLRETLARNRVTTIVGAGGIGKTTVAIAVAHLFEDEGGGSVTFVDLARVSSEEFVPASLASALGISTNNSDTLQAVVSILSRRKCLLLLDTCEHVLSADHAHLRFRARQDNRRSNPGHQPPSLASETRKARMAGSPKNPASGSCRYRRGCSEIFRSPASRREGFRKGRVPCRRQRRAGNYRNLPAA